MIKFIKKEYFILKILFGLLSRDFSKYFAVSAMCYFGGVFRMCVLAKPAYFFCRVIDDCADGDMKSESLNYSDFETLIKRLKAVLLDGQKATNNLEFLLEDVLVKANGNREEVRECLHTFLDAMYVEYTRRKNHVSYSELELKQVHYNSFSPVLEITFMALNSPYSPFIIDELIEIQSQFYSIQDMEEDIEKGILNTPLEYEGKPDRIKEWKYNIIQKSKVRSEKLLLHRCGSKTLKIIKLLVNPIISQANALLAKQ